MVRRDESYVTSSKQRIQNRPCPAKRPGLRRFLALRARGRELSDDVQPGAHRDPEFLQRMPGTQCCAAILRQTVDLKA